MTKSTVSIVVVVVVVFLSPSLASSDGYIFDPQSCRLRTSLTQRFSTVIPLVGAVILGKIDFFTLFGLIFVFMIILNSNKFKIIQ